MRRRHEERGAWFFPYPFDFRHQVHQGVAYRAPWFSGMAQGEALSLFSQLARYAPLSASHRARYRAAAHKAFASLLVGNDRLPWVVARDERAHLWIHEYPIDAPGTYDYTYNGFMFAALGLWDYYAMSRNPLAEQLFDGSSTTLHAYFPALRNPGWLSHYCRTRDIPSSSYHPVHVDLLLQLSWLSGSERFAARSDLLMEDFPSPSLGPAGGRSPSTRAHTPCSASPTTVPSPHRARSSCAEPGSSRRRTGPVSRAVASMWPWRRGRRRTGTWPSAFPRSVCTVSGAVRTTGPRDAPCSGRASAWSAIRARAQRRAPDGDVREGHAGPLQPAGPGGRPFHAPHGGGPLAGWWAPSAQLLVPGAA